ncbi:MAG: hypothetical protein E7J78_19625 [Pantoea sp.]|jgi:hypothetical protein|nr:hypothetical protein [Pantoea sp.]
MADFWASVFMTIGILIAAGFVIGMMITVTGVAKKDPPRSGCGSVEI